jgi:hypothetical protein
MFMTLINRSVANQLDRWAMQTLNRRLPGSFEESYQDGHSLEEVLAWTSVDLERTNVHQLLAPGEHPIWLKTADGDLRCQARVQPAIDPEAPLLLYHHGFNEVPYTSSWRRIFRQPVPFPSHSVCVQAPFHANWVDPLVKGFASLQSVYQTFAGSLRVMELLQSSFEAQGAAHTIAAGVSWGGITSLLYEGVFQRVTAVIPMLCSPNLAQTMWDIADLFERPVLISQAELGQLFDFTPYYRRCRASKVFPLMAENDLFFRFEKHADVFLDGSLITIPDGHITGYWKSKRLRQHVLSVLASLESGSDGGDELD